VKEGNRYYGLSANKRYTLRIINRLAVGSIILVWGSLLMLKQAGLIEENVSTWPFVLTAFGALLIFGGIYRLYARENSARA